jgi:hypothetical protein
VWCSLKVNATQVNRAGALLDEGPEARPYCPRCEITQLILDARDERIRDGIPLVYCAELIAIGVPPELGTPRPPPAARLHRRGGASL